MAGSGSDRSSLSLEEGWPCQRLRIAFALILFYFFETLIGKQLGPVIAIVALGLGLACLASAMQAIKKWKQHSQTSMILEALQRSRRL